MQQNIDIHIHQYGSFEADDLTKILQGGDGSELRFGALCQNGITVQE